jgi:carboxyl-terminal processing protease
MKNSVLMRKILLVGIFIFSFSVVNGQRIIQSTKKNIKVLVNGQTLSWAISPEVTPDRLRIYCSKERNEVIFKTNIDTASFYVANNDTIKFRIVLNSKDTAYTEVIGIKDIPNKISTDDKVYWLSQIWSETKYNFVNIDKLRFNLDSLYKSFIPVVKATRNDYEYYREMKRFIATLHDGHSDISARGQFSAFMDYIPLSLNDFDKKLYITSVRKIPAVDSTWIGAELIEIDGIPTRKYLETKVFPFISASTEQSLWMQGIYDLTNGLKDQSFKGKIKKLDGKIVKFELQHNGETTRTDNDQYWGTKYTYSRKAVDFKWLEGDIAFVSVNNFYPEDQAINEFDAIANELYKAKGVIIDLRNNGGGSSIAAQHLQKYLTKGNSFLNFAWETRTNDGVRRANGNWQKEYKNYFINQAYRFEKGVPVLVPDTLKRITCPTAILISRYTFSAAEDFLVNLYEVPDRPILIGEETGGSTGSPLLVPDLPGGGFVRICTRRICYPLSEKRFVNCGVKPDIEVKQTIDDYLQMKDIVLERAINELKMPHNRQL